MIRRQAVRRNPSYTTKLVNRWLEIQAELAECKSLYEEIDEITEELLEYGFSSKDIGKDENGDTIVVTLVDNFKDKNVVWRPAAVRHHELKQQTIKRNKR